MKKKMACTLLLLEHARLPDILVGSLKDTDSWPQCEHLRLKPESFLNHSLACSNSYTHLVPLIIREYAIGDKNNLFLHLQTVKALSLTAREQLPRVTGGYALYRQLDDSLLYLFRRVKWQFSSLATRRGRKKQAYCCSSGFKTTEYNGGQHKTRLNRSWRLWSQRKSFWL